MKKLTLIIAALSLLFLANQGMAQIGGQQYTEITKNAAKIGTAITYSMPGRIGDIQVGAFYQTVTDVPASGEFNTSYTSIEEKFYGLLTSFTFANGRLFEADMNIRIGLANDEYFVVTPSAMGYVKPHPKLKIGAGLGVRSFTPTFIGSIGWSF